MAEASARYKIAHPKPPYPPFRFENLPIDRNENLWKEISGTYELDLEETCALKHACCSQGICY
jgi:hypothetical protein